MPQSVHRASKIARLTIIEHIEYLLGKGVQFSGFPCSFACLFKYHMQEIRQRTANIVRFLSMAGVVGSLLFMYAYATDDHNIRPASEDVLSGISKTTLFYYGLGVFGVFNVLMNWGIKVYREATGYDKSSRLFKNESHKARILFWLTLALAAINLLITSVVTFVAFIKIEGISAQTAYLPIPIIGLILLFVVLTGLLISVFRNK